MHSILVNEHREVRELVSKLEKTEVFLESAQNAVRRLTRERNKLEMQLRTKRAEVATRR